MSCTRVAGMWFYMLDSIRDKTKKLFIFTDLLAGVCYFSIMIIVLANIVMRNVFGRPIAGTLDYVCLLAVTGTGLALANCALNDGNIAMSIITDFLSRKKQEIVNIIVHLISLGFWSMVVWRIVIYGSASHGLARVSSTALVPLYPFIFLLGFSVLCLCMVLLFNLIYSIKNAAVLLGKTAPAERDLDR
jgi:TRAP-type C4-dicarboxylate transport system permease small subunit